MSAPEKHIVTALAISTTLVVFNIIAVTQGTAEPYYTQLEHFFSNLIPTD